MDVGVVGKLFQQRRFLAGVGQGDVDDVDGQQFGLARIEAAFVHMDLGDRIGGNPQALGRQDGQAGGGQEFGMVLGVVFQGRERDFQFCDANHGGLYLSSKGRHRSAKRGPASRPPGLAGRGAGNLQGTNA